MNRTLFVVGIFLSFVVMFNLVILAVIANVYQDSDVAYNLRAFGDFLTENRLAGEYLMGSLYVGLHWCFLGIKRQRENKLNKGRG
jgi:hypothetical protein